MIATRKPQIWFETTSPAFRIAGLVSIFGIIYLISSRTNGFVEGPTLCPFRALTGLPCPYCGTTRSIGNIVIGNFYQALFFNPIGYVIIAVTLALFIAPKRVKSLYLYIANQWALYTQRSRILLTLILTISPWLLNLPRLM
jgi:hypothetical protein